MLPPIGLSCGRTSLDSRVQRSDEKVDHQSVSFSLLRWQPMMRSQLLS
jgi:hypothetical protein